MNFQVCHHQAAARPTRFRRVGGNACGASITSQLTRITHYTSPRYALPTTLGLRGRCFAHYSLPHPDSDRDKLLTRQALTNLPTTSIFLVLLCIWLTGCTELAQDRSQHPEAWADTSSANFHGKKVAYSGITSCASCHGDDYGGGSSGVSCSECHASGRSGHPVGFKNPDSSDYHGRIFWTNDWNFDQCKVCHGDDLNSGGVVQGCQTGLCHVGEEGIYSCNNCHSDGTEPVFKDVRNHTSTDSVTVGAHTSHIKVIHSLSQPIGCDRCHAVPESYDDPSHIDSTEFSEVTFEIFEPYDIIIDPPFPTVLWYRETATCAQPYCHAGADPVWTQVDGTFAACGSCHTLPPDVGAHSAHVIELGLDCSTCHNGYSSETVMISTHINREHDVNIDLDFGGSFNLSSESCSEVLCHGVLNTFSWFSTVELKCVSCHGGMEGDTTGAPPTDLYGNSESTTLGVGAHEIHMNGGEFSDGIDCKECHSLPDSVLSVGHFDTDLIAEINWGTLATDSSAVGPIWDRGTASCSQTYCHGNFSFAKSESQNKWAYVEDFIEGNDTTAVWTSPGSVECGFCHDLPPKGHNPNFTTCGGCHSSVVASDNVTIIDKAKHINGEIDLN